MRTYGRSLGQSRRIDTRSQNDPAVRAGVTGIHRDMRGNVIGGYGAEGTPLGSKRSGTQLRGLAKWQAMNPGSKLATEKSGGEIGRSAKHSATMGTGETSAASGSLLAKRKKLFEDMKKSGRGGFGTGLRQRAAQLGVTHKGFQRAAGKIGQAPAMVARPGANKPLGQSAQGLVMQKPAGGVPASIARQGGGSGAVASAGTGLRKRKPINPNARVVGQG